MLIPSILLPNEMHQCCEATSHWVTHAADENIAPAAAIGGLTYFNPGIYYSS